MATKGKDGGKKSENTANVFRHEREELGLVTICITLLAVFIGIYFMSFISIMVSVSILIASIFMFDNACKAVRYELKVHGDSLIYTGNEGKCSRIQLPCQIIQKRRGVTTSKGNRIVEQKISIANLLEFDANDTDENGRTILEFLEEVHQQCMLLN